jgi:hypothetical protein
VGTQLSFPGYILENRPPNLQELCDRLPEAVTPKPVRYSNPFKRKIRYPSNWSEVAHYYKSLTGYRCQVCHQQCLRPHDSRAGMSKSQIAQLTLNAHHIDGNTFNDSPKNIFVVCSRHHLDIHRGTGGIPPKGQQNLFDLNFN